MWDKWGFVIQLCAEGECFVSTTKNEELDNFVYALNNDVLQDLVEDEEFYRTEDKTQLCAYTGHSCTEFINFLEEIVM